MAWKISLKIVFITVVIMAASVLASAEEEQDQATAEGIVALNPVLKDHHHLFTYSDPLSVRSSSYASEAVFNPRKFQIHWKYILKRGFHPKLLSNEFTFYLQVACIMSTPLLIRSLISS